MFDFYTAYMDISKIGKIKGIATDVDGVLTDGTFWWDEHELELKRFCFADVTGIPLAQKEGIHMALISGESSKSGMAIVERYAKKLKISEVYKGCHDKAEALHKFAKNNGLELSEICFIGDDIADIPALEIAGLSVAPANAHQSVIAIADMVTSLAGGYGALRELIDSIIEHNKKLT